MSSGCYRCGLSEGSSDRLCETCYRLRFHKGRDVIDLPAGVEPEGLEFSPTMKTFILSSGAVLYASLVSLVVAVHLTNHVRSHGDSRLEFVADEQAHTVVRVSHTIEKVKVERHAVYSAAEVSQRRAG
jgi:hypothetical protein